jgi:hypothetical protein
VDEAGSPSGWAAYGLALEAVDSPAGSGRALRVISGTRTGWAWQAVAVDPGAVYRATALTADTSAGADAFIRVSWYASEDGSGSALSTADSSTASGLGVFLLDTGEIASPSGAESARVRLMLRPSDAGAQAHFDAVTWEYRGLATPTPTPTASPTATVTPSPTPSLTPIATDTPTPTATPAEEPPGPTLRNPRFERTNDEALPVAWRKHGGELSSVASPSRPGLAVRLDSSTASTKWVWQPVAVAGGGSFELSGWVSGSTGSQVFLRVSWYESADGSGLALESVDSAVIDGDAASLRPVRTGAFAAPPAAQSAKVRLMLRPPGGRPAWAVFDDLVWRAFSTSFPTQTASETESPTDTPTPSETPVVSRTPGPTETPDPTETPAPRPSLGPNLLNASFEAEDPEGRPKAWRTYGGHVDVTRTWASRGAASARLWSETDSTKWLYQAVTVDPGSAYVAGSSVLVQGAAEAFLRVSWYATPDASGTLLASEDSRTVRDGPPGRLSVNRIVAPANARSAVVRLMLRPDGPAPAAALFDAVVFRAVLGPVPTATPTPSPTASETATPDPTASASPSATPEATHENAPAAPSVDPDGPEATGAGLKITEVFVNTPGRDEAPFEWVELLNTARQPVSVGGWLVADRQSAAYLPAVTIPPGGFAVVVPRDATSTPGVMLLRLDAARIGNGLANGGDTIVLVDAGGAVADRVTWGPEGAAAPAEGHSLARRVAGVDTNASADWVENTRPSPGSAGVEAAEPEATATPADPGTPQPSESPISTPAPEEATPKPSATSMPASPDDGSVQLLAVTPAAGVNWAAATATAVAGVVLVSLAAVTRSKRSAGTVGNRCAGGGVTPPGEPKPRG